MRNLKPPTSSESARCCTTCRTDHFPGASGVPSCSRLKPATDRRRVSGISASTSIGSREPSAWKREST